MQQIKPRHNFKTSLYYLPLLKKLLSALVRSRAKKWHLGLPWWYSSQESTCQCRVHRFNSWSRKVLHAARQLSPCATSTEAHILEPVSDNYWARTLQLPKPTCQLASGTREATTLRSLHTSTKSGPYLLQLEKAWAQQWRPSAVKNKTNYKEKITYFYCLPPNGWAVEKIKKEEK